MALSRALKIGSPNEVPSIKKARTNCNAIPEKTVRKLIFFLLLDKRTAIPNKVTIPINPVNFSILIISDYDGGADQKFSYLFPQSLNCPLINLALCYQEDHLITYFD